MAIRLHTARLTALFPFLWSLQYHLPPAIKGDHKGRPYDLQYHLPPAKGDHKGRPYDLQYHLPPAIKGDHEGRPYTAFIDPPTP